MRKLQGLFLLIPHNLEVYELIIIEIIDPIEEIIFHSTKVSG